MFTGLIQSVGTIVSAGNIPGGRVFRIRYDLDEKPAIGASVAVNGVCLTVIASREARKTDSVTAGMSGGIISVESYFETLGKTTLGRLASGVKVNLEPALRADGRLDGHIVQGHVTAAVRVKKTTRIGLGMELAVELPEGASAGDLVPEGSAALDGVSLTVAHRDATSFYIQLIGETLEKTTLGLKRGGDLLNLETDILLRGRGLESGRGPDFNAAQKSIKMNQLIQWGYA